MATDATEESQNSDAGEAEYEVEEIRNVKGERTRNSKYLVKWLGYDEETWEPKDNIPSNLIEDFQRNRVKGRSETASSTVQSDVPQPTKTNASLLQKAIALKTTRVGVGDTLQSTSYSSKDVGDLNVVEIRGVKGLGTTNAKYLVKWVGHDEPTWEPMDNVPANLIEAYDSTLSLEQLHQPTNERAITSAESYLCPTCGDNVDGRASRCARCNRLMHHFCATDVCVSLKLNDGNGNELTEFPGDMCYCSPQCYVNRHRQTRKASARSSSGFLESDSFDEESDRNANPAPPGHSKKKGKRKAKQSDEGNYDDREETAGPARKKYQSNSASEQKKGAKTLPSHVVESKKESDTKTTGARKNQAAKKMKAKQVTPLELVGQLVAFCSDHEKWMSAKEYKPVKDLFIPGRVFLSKKGQTTTGASEIRWSYTQFQGKKLTHHVGEEVVRRGIRNHELLSGSVLGNANWRSLCQIPQGEKWDTSRSLDDYVIWDGSARNLETQQLLPGTLEDVENIKNLNFQASRKMKEPTDLFTMSDGSTVTRVRPEHQERFARSASSSFFAYLPISFWKKVVTESNAYAEGAKAPAITLPEKMRFLGIMFYMTVVKKGEYSNYWGVQAEASILGVEGVALDNKMSLKRFQFIRKALSFRHSVSSSEMDEDPAARIRPLMNMLKHTSPLYVELGRNVAVDESTPSPQESITSRFMPVVVRRAGLWSGFAFTARASNLESRLQYSSEIRKHVLEVTHVLHSSKRIVNTDNFYTSAQLLMSLKEVGLYGRGTVRENSKHFPKSHMFAKKAEEARGTMMQGVSANGQIVAASWMDGNAVNIISNADASDQTEVRRLVGKDHQLFPAPRCIAEYNQNMQGVDRMDQLRSKYSLADGHSFQKWHKKLAMAFIDIARCNAYVTRRMVIGEASATRNPHRDFVIALASELISGHWGELNEEEGMFFDSLGSNNKSPSSRIPPRRSSLTPASPSCEFVLSKVQFPKSTRGKRGCRLKGRYETEKTNFCLTHNVCLCSGIYAPTEYLTEVICPNNDWSCWKSTTNGICRVDSTTTKVASSDRPFYTRPNAGLTCFMDQKTQTCRLLFKTSKTLLVNLLHRHNEVMFHQRL